MFPSIPPPVQNHHLPPRSLRVTFHMTYTALSARVLFGTMGLHVVIKSNEQGCCKIKGNLPSYTHMSCMNAPFLGQRTQRMRQSKTINPLPLDPRRTRRMWGTGVASRCFLKPQTKSNSPSLVSSDAKEHH